MRLIKCLENVMKSNFQNFNRFLRSQTSNLIFFRWLRIRFSLVKISWRVREQVMVKTVPGNNEQSEEWQLIYKRTLFAFSVRSNTEVKRQRSCICGISTMLARNRISKGKQASAWEMVFCLLTSKQKSGCKNKSHLYECSLCILVDSSFVEVNTLKATAITI